MKKHALVLLGIIALVSLWYVGTVDASTKNVDHMFDNSDSYWSETHTPSTATQATKSHAGVALRRHVVTCVSASIATDATAQTPLTVNLKDGSSTIASWPVSAPANGQGGVAVCGLRYLGTVSTAVTLQFSAGGVSGSQQSVNFSGYDVY